MLQSSSRAGVKVSMLFSSLAPCPLFGWLVFSGLDFRGMAPMGRISARGGQKDSLCSKDQGLCRIARPIDVVLLGTEEPILWHISYMQSGFRSG